MTRQVCDAARELIERNEGLVLHEYLDAVDVPTIGYGHTGTDVYPGEVITKEAADALAAKDIDRFAAQVERLLGGAISAATSDNEFGAMVSLAYNIGIGAFAHSTVMRRHMFGDKPGAAAAFAMWNRAGGKVLPGLVRRRLEESRLYLTPVVK